MSSIEALWTVNFVSNLGAWGGGILIFETDRIFGGDVDYLYLGKYGVRSPRTLTAEVEVRNHSGRLNSIFGPLAQFKLHIEAPLPADYPNGTVVRADGYVVSNPNFKIALHLIKQADLP